MRVWWWPKPFCGVRVAFLSGLPPSQEQHETPWRINIHQCRSTKHWEFWASLQLQNNMLHIWMELIIHLPPRIAQMYGTYGTVLQTSPDMSQDSSHAAEMLLLVTLKAVAISGMLGWYWSVPWRWDMLGNKKTHGEVWSLKRHWCSQYYSIIQYLY